jgi:SacI restriction endonuclease
MPVAAAARLNVEINKQEATSVLIAEAKAAVEGPIDPDWRKAIEEFSHICDDTTLTHIAFLGTAILAKSTNLAADVWCVKARSSKPGAYSARGLGHGVLVKNAPVLDINLGVTGREPLNNQPYLQIDRVSRRTVVHSKATRALGALCDILDRLEKLPSLKDARAVLRAFIFVRRQWNPTYGAFTEATNDLSVDKLITMIGEFVAEDSEGGKRAQAIVAAMMDLYAGKQRVITSRINDPDRHLPGDVGVRVAVSTETWEKVFEVRDKSVEVSDLYHFAQKAMEHSVAEAAVIAVAANQTPLNAQDVEKWAADRGVSMTYFPGWAPFVRQALFWAAVPSPIGVQALPKHVFARLIELEVSEHGVALWSSKFSHV